MTLIDSFATAFATPGIDLVLSCTGLSTRQLTARGIPPALAKTLHKLSKTYGTPTASSARQRQSITAARDRGLSIFDLQEIEKYATRTKNEYRAWRLRRALTTASGNIRTLALQLLKKWYPKPQPQAGVTIEKPRDGLWTLRLRGDSTLLAPVASALHKAGSSMEEKLAEMRKILSGGAPQPEIHTHLILGVDNIAAIEREEGAETFLRMTNGAVISGAQLAQQTLSQLGYLTLVTPWGGPVNCYRLTRSATFKQRITAQALYPTCVTPGCNTPAEHCEIHHVQAWAQGGETNINNLVPLCRFHNGRNDDDPSKPALHGRVVMKNGWATWRPPWAHGGILQSH